MWSLNATHKTLNATFRRLLIPNTGNKGMPVAWHLPLYRSVFTFSRLGLPCPVQHVANLGASTSGILINVYVVTTYVRK